MNDYQIIEQELMALSRTDQVKSMYQYFRANKGDICYGDHFLAIKVPNIRKVAKQFYKTISMPIIQKFLKSKYNDFRAFALFILELQYYSKNASIDTKEKIIQIMLNNFEQINHWNLTDSVFDMFGNYCWEIQNFNILEDLVNSDSIWKRRVAILTNLQYFKKYKYNKLLYFIQDNITHKHEYIQKANGWALRELGKWDEKQLINFLQKNKTVIPSITKSYACEYLRKTYDIKQLLK
jgi:3-methyladenine DNA glycosylase AlkD